MCIFEALFFLALEMLEFLLLCQVVCRRSCLRMVSKYYHFNHCLTEQVGSSYNTSDWHSRGARLESSTVLCFLLVFIGFRKLL
jgi:hypothetical protein